MCPRLSLGSFSCCSEEQKQQITRKRKERNNAAACVHSYSRVIFLESFFSGTPQEVVHRKLFYFQLFTSSKVKSLSGCIWKVSVILFHETETANWENAVSWGLGHIWDTDSNVVPWSSTILVAINCHTAFSNGVISPLTVSVDAAKCATLSGLMGVCRSSCSYPGLTCVSAFSKESGDH